MEKAIKQYEVLQRASLFLEKHGREAHVAELLLQHYLGVSRSAFFMMMRDVVPADVENKFEEAVEKHAKTGVPIEHIVGYAPFYGRNFHVNEHTLIPRPETEELVQCVIQNAPDGPHTIVDAGTGSGIIAITLALEIPQATVYATDISPEALAVAKENAENLQTDVAFLQGDFLQPFIQKPIKADIVVSNPPYIAYHERQALADTVKNFDPELALFAENNGLAAYAAITQQLQHVIQKDAQVFFEIGYQQGGAVSEMVRQQFPESAVTVFEDINGKDRIVKAQLYK